MRHILATDEIDQLASPRDASAELAGRAACPVCHTTTSSARAQFPWQCGRCGQRWSARRVATVAAYAAWVNARERDLNGVVSLPAPELLRPLLVAV